MTEDEDYMISMASLVIDNAEKEARIDELKEDVRHVKRVVLSLVQHELDHHDDWIYCNDEFRKGSKAGLQKARQLINSLRLD